VRVSEIYLSTQGEGPRVGTPTIFVRFGGCNLRCPGWPCDTQYAIQPEFRKEWKVKTPTEVFQEIEQVAAGFGNDSAVNICYTGGEPFLQKHSELEELTDLLMATDWCGTIEAFSNGQIEYPEWAMQDICFVMDFKLPGSGEHRPGHLAQLENLKRLGPADAVKFVCKDIEEDLVTAIQEWQHYWYYPPTRLWEPGFEPQVFYGEAWGHIKSADLVEKVLAARLPWRLNVQVHNYIWPRDERAR
jgi:7-carboxy-7-deazaguanine synthase